MQSPHGAGGDAAISQFQSHKDKASRGLIVIARGDAGKSCVVVGKAAVGPISAPVNCESRPVKFATAPLTLESVPLNP